MEHTYENFLKLLNTTEEDFLIEINKHQVIYLNKDITIKKSNIEGVGCFTTKIYKKEESLGVVLYRDCKTELGRYVNHSATPNVYLENNEFIALRDLKINEEILVDYIENLKVLLADIDK